MGKLARSGINSLVNKCIANQEKTIKQCTDNKKPF